MISWGGWKGYIPYLMTVGLYIGVANMIGLFGLKSPTKDVGVTGALALMSIVLIEFSGVHKKRRQRLSKKLCGTDPAYAADEYSGNIYPAVITMYATFR